MQIVKEKLNNGVRGLVENLGFAINPILLNIKGENNQLLVFYFHGLYQSNEQRDLNHIDPQKNMTVSQFDEFIDYFHNLDYLFIRPEDLLPGLEKGKRYIIITFDDGYYNNMLALQVLEKYNIPAVFFITADNVRENKAFWWDIIYKYRSKQGVASLKIKKEQDHLKIYKHEQISNYIVKTFGNESFNPWSDIDRPLTGTEVKDLANSPFTVIGNHTYHHALLPNYDRNEIKDEITAANDFLRDLTGITPGSIAFPNGNFNKLVLDVVENVGFRVAFSAMPGKNIIPIDPGRILCLNRFMANNNNIRKYGSFFRLGYTPGSLYSKIKESVNVGNRKDFDSGIK